MFYSLERGPFPANYWKNFESELNFDYYSNLLLFMVPFLIFYQIGPSLLPLYVKGLKKDNPTKVNAFCVDVGSTAASICASFCVLFSVTCYFPYDNKQGMQHCFRNANAILCAYLLADTMFRCQNVPRNFWFMMLHHVVGLLIGQTSMYDQHWQIPKLVFCAMEVANPYINIRFIILALALHIGYLPVP
ncbi:uncharacterized protein LOC142348572 isoform X2 [Convolutriloba macropyga]|uniref:uncharacterized protein LOC142348572 isoform X2 n=1 Tax=Convolutriloba macropyga TaxID=536237 RepID=UPI003F51EEA6